MWSAATESKIVSRMRINERSEIELIGKSSLDGELRPFDICLKCEIKLFPSKQKRNHFLFPFDESETQSQRTTRCPLNSDRIGAQMRFLCTHFFCLSLFLKHECAARFVDMTNWQTTWVKASPKRLRLGIPRQILLNRKRNSIESVLVFVTMKSIDHWSVRKQPRHDSWQQVTLDLYQWQTEIPRDFEAHQ